MYIYDNDMIEDPNVGRVTAMLITVFEFEGLSSKSRIENVIIKRVTQDC